MRAKLTPGRRTLLIIGSLLFLLFFCPMAGGIRNIGNAAGMVISAMVIGYAFAADEINGIIADMKKNRIGKILLAAASGLIILVLVLTLWMTALIISYPRGEAPEDACVVVLGCQVREKEPSRMLRQRLETALEYLEEHPDSRCIVSGGRGTNENLSEAECMYNWLTDRGIDPARLYMEPDSRNTYENIGNSYDILMENELGDTVVIVTNGFHQYRACRFARDRALTAYSEPVGTDILLLPGFWIREMLAVFGECILGLN